MEYLGVFGEGLRRGEEICLIQGFEDKIKSLTQTLKYEDELETESTSALAVYKQQMGKAIAGLKRTIDKYRVLLGDERVAFESEALLTI